MLCPFKQGCTMNVRTYKYIREKSICFKPFDFDIQRSICIVVVSLFFWLALPLCLFFFSFSLAHSFCVFLFTFPFSVVLTVTFPKRRCAKTIDKKIETKKKNRQQQKKVPNKRVCILQPEHAHQHKTNNIGWLVSERFELTSGNCTIFFLLSSLTFFLVC